MLNWIIDWFRKYEREANCQHKWTVLIENYPSFAKDWWKCKRCGLSKVFLKSNPPVKIKHGICNLGHVHIVNGK